MNYIIIEMQTHDGVTDIIPVVKSTYETAIAEFFTKCAYAALSQMPIHSVALLTENGVAVENRHECFDHRQPETEE